MESEIRMKVAKDAENDLKKMEEIHMTSLKNWVTQGDNGERGNVLTSKLY